MFRSKVTLWTMTAVSWCRASLRRVLADLSLYEDGRAMTVSTLDVTLNQLEIVYRELVALDALGNLATYEAAALRLIANAIEEIRRKPKLKRRLRSSATELPFCRLTEAPGGVSLVEYCRRFS